MIHRVQGRDVLLTAQSCEGFLVFVVHNLFRLRFLVCSLFSLFSQVLRFLDIPYFTRNSIVTTLRRDCSNRYEKEREKRDLEM